jgi:hypothetical protein
MLKFIMLFCLILAPTWSMETDIEEALVKLTIKYKSNPANDEAYENVRNVDLIIPLNDISNEIPWPGVDMSLVESLTITMPQIENTAGKELSIDIVWPEQYVIEISWQWGVLFRDLKFEGTFPRNQKTTNLYNLLAPTLFGSGYRYPKIYKKVCERLILTFDQPASVMPNVYLPPSM